MHLHRRKPWIGLVLVLLVTLVLSACGGPNVKTEQVTNAPTAGQFGMTLQAYEKGDFMLDGGVISPLDLSSHFEYLREHHELPKTVLVQPGPKMKVRKDHLHEIALMAHSYGFTAYYEHKGKVSKIVPQAPTP